ncbi:DUF1622 domain-containing protein [Archangium sp.]|jgi:uncharacterized membrane protein|uniref:DUF1622 domain-containing protein n=1 Tax=Archangium sp. TaxID=1872627 RepID=UPI002EDAF31D
MEFTGLVTLAARFFEAAGVGVMVGGAVLAVVMVGVRYRRMSSRQAYRAFRDRLGASILLGLELLVAADIIRTVAEAPTLQHVLVLGLIVLIRTFLSFTLELELEGRWPWQGPRRSRRERLAEEEEGEADQPHH